MSPVYHFAQAGKPWPLAALSHWLHIIGTMRLAALVAGCPGHMDNGHMAAHWLPWLLGTGCPGAPGAGAGWALAAWLLAARAMPEPCPG